MKFVYPEFLYALFAIAIPIVIHLFNFRRFKRIYFSNVQFLKEVTQETQAKSKLKHLLVLLSRILAIIFLVVAFAQPFVPSKNAGLLSPKNKLIAVYVDNSFSMESVGEVGSLLDEAKIKAVEIVENHAVTDKFLVYNNAFNVGDQRLLTQTEAIEKIEALRISPQTKKLSEIYSRSRDAINTTETSNKALYFVSDFQQSVADFDKIEQDSSINLFLVPIKATLTDNLFIDSCWFETPTHLLFQQEKLSVVIKNNSENDVENVAVKLFINNQLVTPASVSVKAKDQTTLSLNYQNKTQGIQQGKIELRDYPVVMDDIFYFSYSISNQLNVLNIYSNQPNKAIASIYKTDSLFNFKSYNINQLDYSFIKISNLVILSDLDELNTGLIQTLKTFVDNGGSLLVFPSEKINFENYRELLSTLTVNYYTNLDTSDAKVREIAYNHPVYKNVFEKTNEPNLNLPFAYAHYVLSDFKTSYKNDILTLNNERAFLTEYKVEKGTVYLSTVGLNKTQSNFTNHALFVPTMYNIALLSQLQLPLFYTIGNNNVITINTNEKDNAFHIKNDNFDFIPRMKNERNSTSIFVGNEITQAENYFLESASYKTGLGFNYNRAESDLTCFDEEALIEQISKHSLNAQLIQTQNTTIKSVLNEIESGKKYWKICVILALIFLAAEIALIKLWK